MIAALAAHLKLPRPVQDSLRSPYHRADRNLNVPKVVIFGIGAVVIGDVDVKGTVGGAREVEALVPDGIPVVIDRSRTLGRPSLRAACSQNRGSRPNWIV